MRKRMSMEKQYRSLWPLEIAASQKRLESDYYAEGYAATWERYLLFEGTDGPMYEQFSREAFDGCDMSDIIFQYNHTGKVFARTTNKTLIVEKDSKGLFVCVDLSKTASARELFQEISSGMITKMSWGFIPGEYYFDKNARTLFHTKVKRIFDVSAVALPANDTTDIHVRSLVEGEIKRLERNILEAEKRKLALKLKLEGFCK